MLAHADVPLARGERRALPLLALALTVLTYLTEPNVFGSIDWVRLHVFTKGLLRRSLLAGSVPLWNPYASLGRPFLTDPELAFFYPPNLLFVLLPDFAATLLFLALHVGLALWGMRRLARALGAGPGYDWGVALTLVSSVAIVGPFASGEIHYGAALCYLPALLLLGVQSQAGRSLRQLGLGALVLGAALTLHPQVAWLMVLATGTFLFIRRLGSPWAASLRSALFDLCGLGLGAAMACALAAVALLPWIELLQQSNRQAASLAAASAFALPWYGWATLLVPTEPGFVMQVHAQLYVAVATTLAGVLGLARVKDPTTRALGGLAVVGGLVAAGNALPIFGWLSQVLPGLSAMRIPSRAAVLIDVGLVLAAGRFLSSDVTAGPRAWRADLPGLALAAVLLALALAFQSSWPELPPDHGRRLALTVGLYGLTAGVLLAHRRAAAWPRRSRLLVQGGLALAVTLDLALAARQLKTQNRDFIERPSEAALARGLVAEGSLGPGLPPPRVSIPKPWARENAGMLQGWSSFTGYEALQLERVWHHLHAFLGLPLPRLITTYPDGAIFRQGAFPFPDMGLTLGFDPVTIQPVFRAPPDPRAYLVFAGRKVADHREATLRMREGHDFHRVALVEDAAYALASAQEGGALSGRVALVHFAANRLELDVDSPAPALLVVAEAWFPGWQATVNGGKADCIPANAWMRAIPVPAGHSRVALRYFPRHLVAGAVISLLAALLVSGLLWRHRGAAPTPAGVGGGS